ncbi:MAG TPA: hypothetical protein GX695_01095 [Acholeplasmataceae bacterium]|nr:hypothetical protein [Acholeplasmataceae bacterium]
MLYFIFKFIGKPIIGLIVVLSNVINIINIRKTNTSVIIKIPYQEKEKRNIVEIFSMILLFLLIFIVFKSFYALVIIAGLVTITLEIITPRIYKNINGLYSEYIIFNKKISFNKIHSWKRVESNKTISFLGMDGLRFDVFMNNEFNKCIEFLNEKDLKEEI